MRPPTKREKQIARLRAEGMKLSTIAEQLGISRRTVETHMYRLYQKFDIDSVHELNKVLVNRGLI